MLLIAIALTLYAACFAVLAVALSRVAPVLWSNHRASCLMLTIFLGGANWLIGAYYLEWALLQTVGAGLVGCIGLWFTHSPRHNKARSTSLH